MPSAAEQELLNAFEVHAPEKIRRAVAAGIDISKPIDSLLPITWLIEMYLRSPAFPACVQTMLELGATIEDELLRHTLLDDGDALAAAINAHPNAVDHRVSLRSAFTPLDDATLLHVAAEFGHANAAAVLIEKGADVNARAAADAHNLNGQPPIFHTVNQHRNHCQSVMQMLIEAGCDLGVRLAGITWGRGFEWETTLFDVTPVSYAQFGLLQQMQRDEQQIYDNIKRLLAAQGRPTPPLDNVPNRYLRN